MGSFGVTITLTPDAGIGIGKDTYIDEANPGTNYAWARLFTGGGPAPAPGPDHRYSYMTVTLPTAPGDADTSRDHEGIIDVYLRLRFRSATAGYNDPQNIVVLGVPVNRTWEEDVLTWNNRPTGGGLLNDHSYPNLVVDTYKDIKLSSCLAAGKFWGSTIDFFIAEDANNMAGKFAEWYSLQEGLGSLPGLKVTYYQKPPAQITDLKVVPDPNDATLPILTWTPSKDSNWGHYEVWRKVGGAAWAQVGSDIAEQGTNAFTDDTGGLTENNVIRYTLREENADGSWMESNVVWLIRPDISTFTLSDATPDVNQKVLATVTPAAIAATPTPVQNTDYYFAWGSGADADRSYGWSKSASRNHVWTYAGSQTPKVQVKNSLGYASDLTSLTAGGPAVTVANIVPIAKVKAAPMLADVGELVTFYGDESYAPAANKNLAAANAYEWDWDYTGVWGTDATSTYPRTTHSWGTAGAKTAALRVKDADGNYSAVVTIVVTVAAVVIADLDALADGYEVLDTGLERQTFVYEGVDTWEVDQGAKRPMTVTIGGFSFTDSDADGIPDDLATMLDVWNNGKRVQLTVLGTARTGRLQGAPVHTEGGWDYKYSWTATVVLDP